MTIAAERYDPCPKCGAPRWIDVSGPGLKKRGKVIAPRCTPECTQA